MRIVLLLICMFALAACGSRLQVVSRSFGNGPSSSAICHNQGIPTNDQQHGACVAFYDSQNIRNKRNFVLGVGVALLGTLVFEKQCECFFGPDRGKKFIP